MLRALLDRGADITSTNNAGNTSVHLAVMHARENSVVVELLVNSGANVWARNKTLTPKP